MTLSFEDDINPETVGLRLCKVTGDDTLHISEDVIFVKGRTAVMTTLNRAYLSGHVGGPIDNTTTYWADQLMANGDSTGEIRLDKNSWNSLKNRWMKCKMIA